MTTRIDRTAINRILTLAQQSPEQEVCGLIGERDGVQRVYPVANGADRKGELFRMDPKGQIDAMRRMREAGERLFAIYHSHPHAPAEPSPRDLDEAAYPEALYLIVSLNTQGVLEMRGFRLKDKRPEPVELSVI